MLEHSRYLVIPGRSLISGPEPCDVTRLVQVGRSRGATMGHFEANVDFNSSKLVKGLIKAILRITSKRNTYRYEDCRRIEDLLRFATKM